MKPVHFGVVINKLKTVLEEKDEKTKVYFLICDGGLKPCYSNKTADPAICSICKFNSWTGLQPFKDKIEILKLSQFNSTQLKSKSSFDYDSVDTIKKMKYKDVQIGYGALSSYISFTRNLEPVINTDFRNYFDDLLFSQTVLTDALLEIISQKNINECYFFNGRTADTRPLYDTCKTKNIAFKSLELIRKEDDEFYVNEFSNCLPHDIDYHSSRMTKLWEETPDSNEEKTKIGSSFFESRRNGKLVGDRRVYTSSQEGGVLPSGFDEAKRNMVIFISSEDEFAGIGDIFEDKALFKTQKHGILTILEKYKNSPNMHFYIRVHPNLANVEYSYHTSLIDFEKNYNNATVIDAHSKVSSYALIDAAETVITFGSSTGVEACFWGKPVILLAGAFYYYLDVCYKPKTETELFKLLETKLPVKEKIAAIKYGYYIVSFTKYTSKNSLSPRPMKLFNKKVGFKHQHLKILGSSSLYRVVEKCVSYISIKLLSKKREIPVKGN